MMHLTPDHLAPLAAAALSLSTRLCEREVPVPTACRQTRVMPDGTVVELEERGVRWREYLSHGGDPVMLATDSCGHAVAWAIVTPGVDWRDLYRSLVRALDEADPPRIALVP